MSTLRDQRGGAVARVSVLTTEGRGAVAVVRVWGREALTVADAAFRPARGARLAQTARGRPRLGRIGAGLGDEVVAVVLDDDPPEVEVHCHGGPAPLALVVAALVAAGAEPRPASDWTLSTAPSPLAAHAFHDLAHAPTVRTAEILLDQCHGALDSALRELIGQVATDPAAARSGLAALLQRSTVGLRLVSGWRVALAGRPNVGKSRLLNALAGYDRAIVAPTPGTTRDVVTIRTAFEGWPVELADTAGLRDSPDPVEASGVALARSRHRAADLIVIVLDRSEPWTEADRALTAGPGPALLVANKADLPAAREPTAPSVLNVSAARGDGIEALGRALARRLVPDPPPPGAGVPFRPEQVARLTAASEALRIGAVGAAIEALSVLLRGPTANR